MVDMADTLDQIPNELTRVHSDLNELAAVLYGKLFLSWRLENIELTIKPPSSLWRASSTRSCSGSKIPQLVKSSDSSYYRRSLKKRRGTS